MSPLFFFSTRFLLASFTTSLLTISSVTSLALNTFRLFDGQNFDVTEWRFDLADTSQATITYLGADVEGKQESAKWSLEVGRYISLLNTQVSFAQRHTSHCLDLVQPDEGSPYGECSFSTCGREYNFYNARVYYWQEYNTDIGYVELYDGLDLKNGNRKYLFLSDFDEDTFISMDGWFMNDKTLSMRWERLGLGIEVEFFVAPSDTGVSFTIKGSASSDKFFTHLNQAGSGNTFVDTISGFRWKNTATPAPTGAPVTPAPQQAINECEVQTKLILEATDSEYSDAGMTETLMSTGVVYVDFTNNANQNALYEAECAAEHNDPNYGLLEGNYQELHYTATCTNSDSGISETLFVSGHPRCFAAVCTEDDQDDLLDDFAIQLMQDRANSEDSQGSNSWTCEGEYSSTKYSGVCDYASQLLNNAQDLKVAKVGIEPTIENEKFLFLLPKDAMVVTYATSGTGVTEYGNACSGNAGTFSQKTFQADCTFESDDSTVLYTIEDFPVCLSETCVANGTAVTMSVDATTASAVVANFVASMRLQQNFDASASCEFTSGAVAVGSIGAWFSLVSLLWLTTIW
jgi:hypothetical protein